VVCVRGVVVWGSSVALAGVFFGGGGGGCVVWGVG